MKYFIQIKPKDKPFGLYLLNGIGTCGQYTTTEVVDNAIFFDKPIHENDFGFLIFDLIGFKSSPKNDELVSDFIIKIINEYDIAEIQELATWKSTFVELPRNGELIAFRFGHDLNIIKKGYCVVFSDKTIEFTEVTVGGINKFLPDNMYKTSNTTEILWKPLIY